MCMNSTICRRTHVPESVGEVLYWVVPVACATGVTRDLCFKRAQTPCAITNPNQTASRSDVMGWGLCTRNIQRGHVVSELQSYWSSRGSGACGHPTARGLAWRVYSSDREIPIAEEWARMG